MKVSMNLYGDQAREVARLLGLGCSNKAAIVPMTATFNYRDVEGRTVIAAQFTSNDAKKVEKSPEQAEKEALTLEAEAAKLRAELKAFMEDV